MADGLSPDIEHYVEDDEILYRGVKRSCWKKTPEGFRLSSQAFTDPQYRVSVNRAKLCDYEPSSVQEDPTYFVCRLLTADIRNEQKVRKYHNDKVIVKYAVDVEAVPLPENSSHAEIAANPEIQSDKIFRRLQERLVLISAWEEGYQPIEA